MKTLIFLTLALLLPCAAMAGEDVRIVKCTGGLAAVQEYNGRGIDCGDGPGLCKWVDLWRTLHAGCIPLDAARRLYADELTWRNRPPAPTVLEPVQVIE